MNHYKVLNKQPFTSDKFSLVPIRFEDRLDIMQWRNEQIYHLRQNKPLTEADQEQYFKNVVAKLFDEDQPNQILFSFLENGVCIGYGGLVHINWIDKNAEISFIMNTVLEKNRFKEIWSVYLELIQVVAFDDLKLHKIYTYAFDLRPHLYEILIDSKFIEEARLKEHCFFDHKYIDVVMHSKINNSITLRKVTDQDFEITFQWATNKDIRQYSIQKKEIGYDEHEKWFFSKIQADDCYYYIAIYEDIPIGSIRFDIININEVLISFLLNPKYQGRGFGKQILEKGCDLVQKNVNLKKIVGVVHESNLPSLKTFRSLNFNEYRDSESYITFFKNINNENR